MSCPFCWILDTKRERIIAEYPRVFVVLSNPRLMPGHTLVIPKRHVEKLSQLADEERKELIDTVALLQERILARVSSGCDVTQHYRPFIRESRVKVNHLHIHLRPREFEDELYRTSQRLEKFGVLSLEESEKFSKLLS